MVSTIRPRLDELIEFLESGTLGGSAPLIERGTAGTDP